MKIIYDHQIFSHQDIGGISRCFSSLIMELENSSKAEVILPLLFSNNIYLTSIKAARCKPFFPTLTFKGQHRIMFELNKYYTMYKLKHLNDFDIFHATSDDPYFLKLLKGRPFAITIHDMIQEEYTDEIPGASIYVKNRCRLAFLASVIITPSHFTKKKLIERYPDIDPDKVKVVYHAPSPYCLPGECKFRLPEKFFLYVGHRIAYKNFPLVLKALAGLKKEFSDIKLVCAGGGKFTGNERKLIAGMNLSSDIFQSNMTDDELAYSYSNALAYICPSFSEGFCLPILEAFSHRCPELLSSAGPLEEISGGAAWFFNPDRPDELMFLMNKIIKEKKERLALVEKGIDRLLFFSAGKNVEGILDAYKFAIAQ